eukprot:GHVN01023232.1.p1 GENE.GHVN01023232.1~~GHVN01023232.1.p1  ORF type:complete len:394 (+),score=51.05 GHVN01023232.1:71-1252(+)
MADPSELQELRKNIPPDNLAVSTVEYVQFKLYESRYRNFTVNCTILEGYPTRSPHIVAESKTLPPSSLIKITAKLQSDADELSSFKTPCLEKVFWSAKKLIDGTLLLMARDEVVRVKELLTPNDSMKISEQKGLISLRVVGGTNEVVSFKVEVPPDYPDDPIKVIPVSSTYSEDVTAMFFSHAVEIARRCAKGIPPSQSIMEVDRKQEVQQEETSSESPAIEIRNTTVSQMKSDVKFLHRLSAVKEVVQENNNRSARKLKKLVEKKEMEKEKDIEEKLKLKDEESNKFEPCLSVWPVTEYLVARFIRYLPSALCESCGEALCFETVEGGTRSQDRALCGHWFHGNCLDELMTKPPFGKVLHCSFVAFPISCSLPSVLCVQRGCTIPDSKKMNG